MTYPGGKNARYHQIINLIPPHHTYIEPFAGSAAIYRRIRRANHSILIERDRDQAHKLASVIAKKNDAATEVIHGDALEWLADFTLSPYAVPDTFIYADPPYLFSTRASQRNIYNCEFGTEAEHRTLLRRLLTIGNKGALVMISGYYSDLYAKELGGWYTHTYTATTRGGTIATEWLWMNYPPPSRLHDYRYLGDDYRERERIKRKATRWVEGLARLPQLERLAILSEIEHRHL